jgi:hypothetical protein
MLPALWTSLNQRIEIVHRALKIPARLIAENAGINGSIKRVESFVRSMLRGRLRSFQRPEGGQSSMTVGRRD